MAHSVQLQVETVLDFLTRWRRLDEEVLAKCSSISR